MEEKLTVLGIDVKKGYSGSKSELSLYSFALLDSEGKVLDIKEDSTIFDLIIYIKKIKPKILATDNIFELVENETDLKRLIYHLPLKTEIIQITGNPSSPKEELIEIAKRENLYKGGKLSPKDTAIILAKLALKGYGYKLKLYENETIILVGKKIEPSGGGMSENRYKRNIYANILQVTNSIKNILNNNAIPYDFFYNKKRGIFIVQENIEKVRKIIKPYKGYGIQIKVFPLIKRKIFTKETLNPSNQLIILGYDPGLTVGLAFLNFDGELIELISIKYTGIEDLRNLIIKIGKPVIVSTDKAEVPWMVSKLASSFGAIIFKPDKDLEIKEKKKISQNFLENRGIEKLKLDSHKRDALASAIIAYNKFYPIYKTIKEEINKQGLDLNPDNVFEKVIKYNKNIKEAIEEEINNKLKTIEESRPKIKVGEEKPLDDIKKKIKILENNVDFLLRQLRNKEEEIKRYKKEIEKIKEENYLKIRQNKEILILKEQIRNLHNEIKKLELERDYYKEFLKEILNKIKEAIENKLIILELNEELEDIANKTNIKNIILIKKCVKTDEKIINTLLKNKIKCILYLEDFNNKIKQSLEMHDVIVLPINEIEHYKAENIYFVNRNSLELKIKEKEIEISKIREKARHELYKMLDEYSKLKI
jgi:predicted RNase H-like nuclease (RuvC/YqgF family)